MTGERARSYLFWWLTSFRTTMAATRKNMMKTSRISTHHQRNSYSNPKKSSMYCPTVGHASRFSAEHGKYFWPATGQFCFIPQNGVVRCCVAGCPGVCILTLINYYLLITTVSTNDRRTTPSWRVRPRERDTQRPPHARARTTATLASSHPFQATPATTRCSPGTRLARHVTVRLAIA